MRGVFEIEIAIAAKRHVRGAAITEILSLI
jgi:hypothetical protein